MGGAEDNGPSYPQAMTVKFPSSTFMRKLAKLKRSAARNGDNFWAGFEIQAQQGPRAVTSRDYPVPLTEHEQNGARRQIEAFCAKFKLSVYDLNFPHVPSDVEVTHFSELQIWRLFVTVD